MRELMRVKHLTYERKKTERPGASLIDGKIEMIRRDP
jgi:hypothetical protein